MGKLVLVNLPIGNPEDITKRSIDSLKNARTIFCEDTRSLKSLMGHLGISVEGKEIQSFHDHSSDGKFKKLEKRLQDGETIYYASDAGSPIISDPAYPIVKAAIEKGIEVDSVSGISSVIMALELSGLPPIPFSFHGFTQRDKGKKRNYFESILQVYGTHIFFESPHRLKETLELLHSLYEDQTIVLAKELTKTFQKVYRFKASEIPSAMEQIDYRGEFVLMVSVEEKSRELGSKIDQLAREVLESKGKPKPLSKLLAEILKENKQEVYKQLSRS